MLERAWRRGALLPCWWECKFKVPLLLLSSSSLESLNPQGRGHSQVQSTRMVFHLSHRGSLWGPAPASLSCLQFSCSPPCFSPPSLSSRPAHLLLTPRTPTELGLRPVALAHPCCSSQQAWQCPHTWEWPTPIPDSNSSNSCFAFFFFMVSIASLYHIIHLFSSTASLSLPKQKAKIYAALISCCVLKHIATMSGSKRLTIKISIHIHTHQLLNINY